MKINQKDAGHGPFTKTIDLYCREIACAQLPTTHNNVSSETVAL